jgi:hypothetical protein
MFAFLLLPVEPRGLSAHARRAVRGAAVAKAAAAHRSRQVRGHGRGFILGVFLGRPFGHPPFFALRRAAFALASEVARPPRRPSACAARFMPPVRDRARPPRKSRLRPMPIRLHSGLFRRRRVRSPGRCADMPHTLPQLLASCCPWGRSSWRCSGQRRPFRCCLVWCSRCREYQSALVLQEKR